MEDVEAPVEPQEENVVGRDVFDVLEAVDHGELGDDGERLEPDAEGPEEVDGVEGLVDDDGGEQGGPVEVVVREGVRLAVHTQAEGLLDLHEVDGVGGEGDEDDLHDEDVERLPAEEEVEVAADEDGEEELLGAVGEAWVGAGVPMTLRVAMILSSSMSTAMRWRKSPISWKMSITRAELFNLITTPQLLLRYSVHITVHTPI